MLKKSADGNYSFDAHPKGILRRKESVDTFKTMVKLLTEGDEERKKLAAENASEDERLRVEYRMLILSQLACCSANPEVNIRAIKTRLLKSDDSDIASFNIATMEVLMMLGLD
jgi:hypothetical protein